MERESKMDHMFYYATKPKVDRGATKQPSIFGVASLFALWALILDRYTGYFTGPA